MDDGDVGWLIEGVAAFIFLAVFGWGMYRDWKDEKENKK